jgi:hypothetical protein
MVSLRRLALPGIAAALIVAAPAVAESGGTRQNAVPPAHADGGDAPPILPSIVNTRLVRAEAALSKATDAVDAGQPAQGAAPINAAVANVTAAWSAEQYVIKTAPPAPVGDSAYSDGSGGAGPSYAGPEDTGFAVLSAEHDVITTAVGIAETSDAGLSKSALSAITAMQNSRDAAIKYIHKIAPPPVADGTPVGSTWDAVMPGYVAVLDDEIQQLKGRLALTKFSASTKTALTNARLKAADAKDLINSYWPPVPAG